MAIIYYPSSAAFLIRETATPTIKSLYIGVSPNNIFFFDTASQIDAISSSITDAISASYAVTSSGYCISASFAGSAVSASYATNGGGGASSPSTYTTINTGSFSNGTASITVSLDVPEQLYNLSNTVSWSLNFTHSNTFPVAGKVADVSLTINNTATMTSSLVFPSTWTSVGGGWPSIITASKHAVLALKVYDTGLIVGSWGQQI